MSALHPKADIRRRDQDVCFEPKDGVTNFIALEMAV
jgi:hypothetical protein